MACSSLDYGDKYGYFDQIWPKYGPFMASPPQNMNGYGCFSPMATGASGSWVSGFSGIGIVERWNEFFFPLILFACVANNAKAEECAIPCISSRKYQ